MTSDLLTDARVAAVFTVEERDALYEYVLGAAKDDERVVAGAVVGSLAVEEADRFSDVDLTFGISDDVRVADVLDDWTRALRDERAAVPLVDLDRGPTIYRVFLLAELLQLDLSMTPAADFRSGGPRFRLLFGEVAAQEADARSARPGDLFIPTPQVVGSMFGWGVIYAMHAYRCVQRGSVWQAEHYVGAVRDHALSLACLRQGVTVGNGRGYDQLSAGTLARFEGTHVGALGRSDLHEALAVCVSALIREGEDADIPDIGVIAERLDELLAPATGTG